MFQRDAHYTQGKAGAWYSKGESPILAEWVKEGKLSPVAERTGEEPRVMEGVGGVGNYGDTWSFMVNSRRTRTNPGVSSCS